MKIRKGEEKRDLEESFKKRLGVYSKAKQVISVGSAGTDVVLAEMGT